MKKIIKLTLIAASSGIIFSTIKINNLENNTQTVHAQVITKAFPTAYGYAENVTGGRGGEICAVTNTQDSGVGSLRNCVDNVPNPKTIIFQTGGTIEVNSPIKITDDTTIAGQTATGGGITIKNTPENIDSPLEIKGNNIIIRNITIRPGASDQGSCTLDGLHINNSNNVIADHISTSWATDETMSVYKSRNVTIQNSISSEGLVNSTHSDNCNPDGPFDPHSMGMLGSHSDNITFYRNYMAHFIDRNPRFAGGAPDGLQSTGRVDVINNISYNYQVGHNYTDSDGLLKLNSLYNILKEGKFDKPNNDIKIGNSDGLTQVYEVGTKLLSTEGQDITSTNLTVTGETGGVFQNAQFTIGYAIPISENYDFENEVIQNSGNSFGVNCDGTKFPRRDSIDQRVTLSYTNGTGTTINSPSEVGAWETIEAGEACEDSDNDYLPDQFELRYFGNLDYSANQDHDTDGYTNIEEYFNSTKPNGDTGTTPSFNTAPKIIFGDSSTTFTTIKGATLNFQANVHDDGLPSNQLVYRWTKLSGKNSMVIETPDSNSTSVFFKDSGKYKLEFKATDGELSSTIEVNINVVR